MPSKTPLSKQLVALRTFWQQSSVRKVVQLVWVILVVLFVALALYRNWGVINALEWSPRRLNSLLLAVGTALLHRLISGLSLIWTIRKIGEKKISIGQGLRVYFQSNLTTYVPGTYWFIPARILMFNQYGISPARTGVSMLLEQLLTLLGAAIIGLWGVPIIGGQKYQTLGYILFGLVVVLGAIMAYPRNLNRIVSIIGRLLKKEVSIIELSYPQILLLFVSYLIMWFAGASSFFLVVRIFVPSLPLSQLGLFAAIFCSAWLIGFLVPIAPHGLVIREGALGLALTAVGIPSGYIVFIVTLSRLMFVLEDVVWGGVSLFPVNKQVPESSQPDALNSDDESLTERNSR